MSAPPSPSPSRPRPEAFLQSEILLRWGSHPRIRLWRQNSGLLWAPGTGGTLRRIRVAVPGAADITGLIAPCGQRLEIECKAATGRQKPEQIAFQNMVRALGGIYVLARVMADVDAVLLPILQATP